MSYWKEVYGQRSNEFIEGIIAGLIAYAWWKDGIQYIGQQRPDGTGAYILKKEIEKIKQELDYKKEGGINEI